MNNYSDTQSTRNSEYKDAYAKWVASLSPKERCRLEEQGLLTAQVDTYHLGKPKDVSELPLAAETQKGEEEPSDPGSEQTWAALRLLIGDLLADPNPALALDCWALVSGIGFMGESMSTIAKRHCVTRAAVSKRCVQLTRQLQLSPSRAMRSLTARESYRATQRAIRKDHERFNSK